MSDEIETIKFLDVRPIEYECPAHGNIGQLRMSINFSKHPELDEDFCLRCYMDKLVEIGVSRVKEIKVEEKDYDL